MQTNDQILLKTILDQQRANVAPEMSEHEFFDIFAAEQILKNCDLSYDEIQSGIVEGGADGGVDSIYLFINNDLIQEDCDFTDYQKRDIPIDLHIIQTKTSPSFSEAAVDKLKNITEDLLDLSKDISALSSIYNNSLLGIVSMFRDASRALASQFPRFRFHYYYASLGVIVDRKVERKASLLKEKVVDLFSRAEVEFQFIPAKKLIDLAATQRTETFILKYSAGPISIGERGSFICLVKLKNYFEFITKEGNLNRGLFESNVRDYQGNNQVNKAILYTLGENDSNEDFWWLNNGITIIANMATHTGGQLTMEQPQIVNGLQTSMVIYNFFKNNLGFSDDRNILIRVIVPEEDTGSREKIIKATNNQSPIPIASLRASDRIHRNIETYFQLNGLFYDRRKNYYKNLNKPIYKIISIPYLAQVIMAIFLQRPDDARARPSSLLKRDEIYEQVFSEEYPLEMFLKSTLLMREIDGFLKQKQDLGLRDRGNVKFHLAMYLTMLMTDEPNPNEEDIKDIDISAIRDRIGTAFDTVWNQYEALGKSDQVAKGTELRDALLNLLNP